METLIQQAINLAPKKSRLRMLMLEGKIKIPTLHGTYFLRVHEILRCEAEGNYTKIKMKYGKQLLVSKTLKHIQSELPKDRFLRIHQSHLINVSCISVFHKSGLVELEGGECLPISRMHKSTLNQILKLS